MFFQLSPLSLPLLLPVCSLSYSVKGSIIHSPTSWEIKINKAFYSLHSYLLSTLSLGNLFLVPSWVPWCRTHSAHSAQPAIFWIISLSTPYFSKIELLREQIWTLILSKFFSDLKPTILATLLISQPFLSGQIHFVLSRALLLLSPPELLHMYVILKLRVPLPHPLPRANHRSHFTAYFQTFASSQIVSRSPGWTWCLSYLPLGSLQHL